MAVEPANTAQNEGAAGGDAPSADGASSRPGDFERYALIAALTLVVLCLLLWDRWQRAPGASSVPSTDRTLRVEIGGSADSGGHAAPGDAPHGDRRAPPAAEPRAPQTPPGVKPRTSTDPPAAPVPPPAPPQRTYTVKDGDTLYAIAKRELGASSRAQEIADLNGLADASKLKVGQVL